MGVSTRPHPRTSPADLPSEEKRIRAAGGFVKKMFGVARVNGDLALSRAFGDIEYKEVRPGKVRVACCPYCMRLCFDR